MHIAILNWCDRQVGGVEVYLDNLVQELERHDHSVLLCIERDIGGDTEPIHRRPVTETLRISEIGPDAALDRLRAWKPDVIFRHVFDDAEFERKVFDVAPTVFFAHAYYGTCISGLKMHRIPSPRPCDRRFGPACLALYFPRRCGGRSPLTMLREYRRHARQGELIPRYDAIVTHSEHMRSEYVKHGARQDRVHVVPFVARTPGGGLPEAPSYLIKSDASRAFRLLFLGRMDYAKGAHLLLEALPRVASAVGRRVVAMFAGDGPERPALEREAARLLERDEHLGVEFLGWVRRERLGQIFAQANLLVVPSLWPEPFGQVGIEAGRHSLPAVAFDVGGISAWLHDGVNGRLVPRGSLSASALADAIVECLRDPDLLATLARGAGQVAYALTMENHIAGLIDVFERCRRDTPSDERRLVGGQKR